MKVYPSEALAKGCRCQPRLKPGFTNGEEGTNRWVCAVEAKKVKQANRVSRMRISADCTLNLRNSERFPEVKISYSSDCPVGQTVVDSRYEKSIPYRRCAGRLCARPRAGHGPKRHHYLFQSASGAAKYR